MPWDKRGYYYRKKRIGARVVSEYVGRGFMANLEAGSDQTERDARECDRRDLQAQRAKDAEIEATIAAADELINAAMNEALEAAGYHRHARGQWRKRRDTKSN
jgi:hypothetical protein